MDGIEEQLDDFDKDKCIMKNALIPNKTLEGDKLERWWCYTQTCYSAHFYGFFAGLFLGICILQTPNLTKGKKYLRGIALFVFLVILGTGLYQNIWESLEDGKVSQECSMLEYEEMCQAKCYCGFDMASLNSTTYYQHCKGYKICNICPEAQTGTAHSGSVHCSKISYL